MKETEALKNLTTAAETAKKSGASQSDIDRAVQLSSPPNPLINPKPPHNPLAGS